MHVIRRDSRKSESAAQEYTARALERRGGAAGVDMATIFEARGLSKSEADDHLKSEQLLGHKATARLEADGTWTVTTEGTDTSAPAAVSGAGRSENGSDRANRLPDLDAI